MNEQSGQVRMLVAIASYGDKNLGFLREIIQAYKTMAMQADVVVFSESPKSLGADVKVEVGLPTPNPWSLPFAHKRIFAEKADQYDLFVYSEDDIEVKEEHIRAFLVANNAMQADEIPGYIRYEVAPDGTKLLTDVHASFHWKAESVRTRDGYTVAEFTNDHAGFYILTKAQLKKCLASGGFLREPYYGRYGFPETAATDPYTICGFRKVICISHLPEFLIRHMSNLYVNRHGVTLGWFEDQVRTLIQIGKGNHPANTLCGVESKMPSLGWSKGYYERVDEALLEAVPAEATNILSVGCGWGATEARLKERGARVTVLPLDSVFGAGAEQEGYEVVYGSMTECLEKLGGRKFDCVMMTNLLHLQRDPTAVIQQLKRHVGNKGCVVLKGPNFDRISLLVKRKGRLKDFRGLESFEKGGINTCGPRRLGKWLRRSGFEVTVVRWINHSMNRNGATKETLALGRLTAREWILKAVRSAAE
jgi:2-polyprenyl-3-methyl-5-hydroxy-6-metoxy-1,4-benzoquinol methylase